MKDSHPLARAGWVIALIATLLSRGSYGAGDSAQPTSQEKPGGSEAKKSLDEWLALRKLVNEISRTSPGTERIARCEAFLKEHPEYPDAFYLLDLMVTDYLRTPGFDTNKATDLLERLAGYYGGSGYHVVEEYCLPYHLPIASCQTILASSRKAFEASRRLPDKGDESSSPWGVSAAEIEPQLLQDEGRVLLEAGDFPGALSKLLQAEESRKRDGTVVSLRDAKGRDVRYFPTPSGDSNWLNLSLAEAYVHLGKRSEAVERLRWIQGAGEPEDGFRARLNKLEEELNVTPPEMAEFRGEPVPAPGFELEDLQGKKVRLSDFSGRVVLVLLWSTT